MFIITIARIYEDVYKSVITIESRTFDDQQFHRLQQQNSRDIYMKRHVLVWE